MPLRGSTTAVFLPPAAARPRAPPEAPAPLPDTALLIHRAWLDQRLREELEQLTEEEAIEVLFGSTTTLST
eukprot:scaffold39072_cov54-Phaeocystis_antarctica.AAC.1